MSPSRMMDGQLLKITSGFSVPLFVVFLLIEGLWSRKDFPLASALVLPNKIETMMRNSLACCQRMGRRTFFPKLKLTFYSWTVWRKKFRNSRVDEQKELFIPANKQLISRENLFLKFQVWLSFLTKSEKHFPFGWENFHKTDHGFI